MRGANRLPLNGISSFLQNSRALLTTSHTPACNPPRLLRSRGCGPARTDDRDGGTGARGQPPPDLPRDATDRKDGRRALHQEGEQMSAYRTKSGARLTDEDIEHLGEAAERGEGSRQDAEPAHTGGSRARARPTGRRGTRTPVDSNRINRFRAGDRTDLDAEVNRSRRGGREAGSVDDGDVQGHARVGGEAHGAGLHARPNGG